jgi:hypothetical protein
MPDGFCPSCRLRHFANAAGIWAERRLIIAVLEDAVMCYQKYMCAKNSQERRLFDQAEAWLMRRDRFARTGDSFSFEFICDTLGLDAEGLRERFRRWRHEQELLGSQFVSSRQRCRWRAVYREPYKERMEHPEHPRIAAYG